MIQHVCMKLVSVFNCVFYMFRQAVSVCGVLSAERRPVAMVTEVNTARTSPWQQLQQHRQSTRLGKLYSLYL
jgi:hypothetical protein